MGLLDSLTAGGAEKAAEAARLAAMKRGKSPEQKRVIDFFMAIGGSSSGCGGCLGNNGGSGITMDEYLKIVQERADSLNVKQRAMEKIGLDESQIQEIEPIMLNSFDFKGDVFTKYQSGWFVSNVYSITWIFFSAEQLYTYQIIFDTTSDDLTEITRDYFYTDITCFSTVKRVKEYISTSITQVGGGCLRGANQQENTSKTHYEYNSFAIIAPGTEYSVSMSDNPTIERSIQAAKAMLREKKYRK